jgi:hypothetical protein
VSIQRYDIDYDESYSSPNGRWCFAEEAIEAIASKDAEIARLTAELAAMRERCERLAAEVRTSRLLFDDLQCFNDGCGCCGSGRNVDIEVKEDAPLQDARKNVNVNNDLSPKETRNG